VTKQIKPHSLIVGGTRGIGRALANLLATENHRVSVIGRRPPSGKPNRKVHFWSADLLDPAGTLQALENIVKQNGKLNNLIFLQRFKGQGDKWQGELATSLSATKLVIEFLAQHFQTGHSKSIVLVSSAAAHLVAQEQDVSYHVAKAGLQQMGRYYAVLLGPKGFRVNIVSPGTVIKSENRNFYMRDKKLQRLCSETIPLGRMGKAEEVAETIAFLCSDKASFITGQNIMVDGGVNLLSPETLARKLAN
jgi:NAD(P)-dependent dehydrogenase (short-subunit alcohol dehydrogenase family)